MGPWEKEMCFTPEWRHPAFRINTSICERESGKQWFRGRNNCFPSPPGLRHVCVCVWAGRLWKELRTSAFRRDHIQRASPSSYPCLAAGWKAAGCSLFWWKQLYARRDQSLQSSAGFTCGVPGAFHSTTSCFNWSILRKLHHLSYMV